MRQVQFLFCGIKSDSPLLHRAAEHCRAPKQGRACESGALALRIAANTRWSRAHENGKCTGETQLASPNWMGRARGVVDALRGLELDLARHQDRLARFAADFVRSDSFSNRDRCAASCFDRPQPITAAA